MSKWRFGIRTAWLILGLVLPMLWIQYGVSRDSSWLLLFFGIAFVTYIFLIFKVEFNFKQIFILAVVIRLTLFFGAPTLSDDYFRFLWDGQLMTEGINPYQDTPSDLIDQLPDSFDTLYTGLNSSGYHSTYPPVSQYIFYTATLVGNQSQFWSMTVIRSLLLIFEIGVIWLLFQLTANASRVMIYALNPLVILELVGSLHFEGVVIFFVLLAMWLYKKGYWKRAALALSFGVLTKLTPLMFLPVLIRKLGWKKSSLSFLIIAVSIVVVSIPFFDLQVLSGFGSGIDLFFRKFEFNAGIFFFVREIGYWFKGYDVVQTMGPWLSVLALGLILVFVSFIVKKETEWSWVFTIVLFIQLMLATTVHPWYVIPLVAFSCITGLIFPVVWSGLVFVSYLGYSNAGYHHPMEWIAVEYILVIFVAVLELYQNKPMLKHV
ncbi:MAG: glycosyltransferase 87 family protein [Reichenbachiella sp.]|uniref:glycosyltransferase 87 family protein n=1 Tax=Reichenbachiella sp. TaxID=2184521 RepID=UPI00329865E2